MLMFRLLLGICISVYNCECEVEGKNFDKLIYSRWSDPARIEFKDTRIFIINEPYVFEVHIVDKIGRIDGDYNCFSIKKVGYLKPNYNFFITEDTVRIKSSVE